MDVKIISLGKFDVQAGTHPYYVGLELKEGDPPAIQKLTTAQFFQLVNGLLMPIKQRCGQVHVPTVSIPDEELARVGAPVPEPSRIIVPNSGKRN
jgi:hypothetical protein